MAKATLKLHNGTVVTLEGTQEEVKHLLELYGGEEKPKGIQKPNPRRKKVKSNEVKEDGKPDLNEIVNLVKDCNEAESIETQVLDRSSQVDRTLLPLYVVHEYLGNAYGLTSGDVTKVTTDLGIRIRQPNASRTLSGTASKYVIGDNVKAPGRPVRYKLSRRGLKYMKEVLAGNEGG